MKNKKTILLSGASRGIGLDIATKLVKNKYNLIVCSRSTSKELNDIMDQNDSITHYKVDLESNKSTNEFLNSIQDIEFYGLINNAGYAREGILATLPEVEIEKMININLKSSILLSRFFSRNIIKYKTSGRIINISSIISDRGFNGLSVYSATKAGLNGLTLSLARELGRTGTTVNAILPGFIETEMSSGLNDKQLNQILRRTPIGKLAEKSDISSLVEYLLSEDASSITGQLIKIDGGNSVWKKNIFLNTI